MITREEKIERLKKAREVLKEEFIGLDSIIDRVIECISPWYLTPEIIERPVVVSLFGLTGTGKTSLVKRLFNLLDLMGKSIFLDCGEQVSSYGTSGLFSDKLDRMFDSSQVSEGDLRYSKEELEKFGVVDLDTKSIDKTDPIDFAFVLDEFQYLKTKDEDNKEIDRPEGRAIWTLIDSGMIDMNYGSRTLSSLIDYADDLKLLESTLPGIELEEGYFPKNISKHLSTTIPYHRWIDDEEVDDEEKRKGRGHVVLENSDLTFIAKRLNLIKKGLGFKFMDSYNNSKTLTDLVELFIDYLDLITKPRMINCSKALVFILGNLDEAFGLTGEDMDPDVDADVYHEMTSRVNIMDIKQALKRRFRDEQIGRLGNNIIIYPSLTKDNFREIIKKDLNRLSKKFESVSGLRIGYTEPLKELIYEEGVYPIQGVRPIYTTINSLITPRFSDILMETVGNAKSVIIDTRSKRFDSEEIDITLIYHDQDGEVIKEVSKNIKTTLGSLRDPQKCKKLAIQGIHEASHAVIYSRLTGDFPSAIVAGAINGGGYIMEDVGRDSLSAQGIYEFENRVLVALAGYYGERNFFDEDKCTLGASSDILNCWREVSKAFGQCGYLEPISYWEGADTQEIHFLPNGLPWSEISGPIKKFITQSCIETKRLIKEEEKLILEVGKYLSENRCMGIEVYKEMINKYATGFSTDSMRELKIKNDNYYKTRLYEK